MKLTRNLQYYKFCLYGFFKNLKFFNPFFLLFFLEKEISFFEIGILYALKEIIVNLFEIPSGIAADLIGRRKSMQISFAGYIVSFLIFYFTGTFWSFLGAMLFFALGDAFRTGTHKAMIFTYLKNRGWEDQKVYYYGHTRSWSQLGSAVSALIAGAIVFWQGSYSTIFLFSIIPYLLDMALIMSYPAELEGPPGSEKHQSLGRRARSILLDMAASFKDPLIIKTVSNQALYSGFYKASKDFLQPLLKTTALAVPVFTAFKADQRTAVITGLVYTLLYLLTSRAAKSAGPFARRLKHPGRAMDLTLFGGLGLAALAGVFILLEWPVPAVAAYVGIYLVENIRKPVGVSMISELFKGEVQATALSVGSQAETLFSALTALMIGGFVHLFGLGTGLAAASSVVFVIGVMIRVSPSSVKDERGSSNRQ